jgi:hypothetical protein
MTTSRNDTYRGKCDTTRGVLITNYRKSLKSKKMVSCFQEMMFVSPGTSHPCSALLWFKVFQERMHSLSDLKHTIILFTARDVIVLSLFIKNGNKCLMSLGDDLHEKKLENSLNAIRDEFIRFLFFDFCQLLSLNNDFRFHDQSRSKVLTSKMHACFRGVKLLHRNLFGESWLESCEVIWSDKESTSDTWLKKSQGEEVVREITILDSTTENLT